MTTDPLRTCQVMIALFLMLFVLAACGSKVNESNYAKIEIDMTEEQVKSLLGTPTESSSINVGGLSGTSSKWVAKEGTINVQFLNGKAKAKAFSKPSGRK
jgi:SmpA / OmlA family